MTEKQIENKLVKLQALKDQKKAIDKEIAAIETAIQEIIGAAEVYPAGRYIIRWTRYETHKFDSKAFKIAHPKLYNQYYIAVPARRFTFDVK